METVEGAKEIARQGYIIMTDEVVESISMKIALVAAILLATGVSVNAFSTPWSGYLSSLASAVTLWQSQGIIGNVTFALGGSCGAGPIPAFWEPILPNIGLVVRPSTGIPINVHLNWTPVGNCAMVASFVVGLATGNYSLDVTCLQEGARCASLINPISVTVEPNKFTVVSIDANTKLH